MTLWFYWFLLSEFLKFALLKPTISLKNKPMTKVKSWLLYICNIFVIHVFVILYNKARVCFLVVDWASVEHSFHAELIFTQYK